MKNVDNIIDAVSKDVSGIETGIGIMHRIREVSLSPWSSPYKKSPPKDKVTCANKILSKSNSLSKPAPACKKKIMHPSHIKIDDVISAVINNVSSECSVAAVDLFCDSPLKNLVCMGCLRHFNGKNLLANEKSEKIYSPENFRDYITVDLCHQILTTVCGNCEWWTKRNVEGRLKSYSV